MTPDYDAIIFDLGDVLFDWDSSAITALPKKSIHLMMNTTTWYDLDCGRLSAEEAYAKLAGEFKIHPPTLVRRAIEQAQTTLRVNDQAAILLEEILAAKKRDPRQRIKVYAMSNISEESFHFLRHAIPFPWEVFDGVFTSWDAGLRKPDLGFYEKVLAETGCDPRRTLYLDDRVENICAGRMLGLRGEIVHRNDRERLFRLVRNLLLNDGLQRAENYLRANARKLDCVVIGDRARGQEDVYFQDNFSQLIIWGLTDMEDIVYLSWPDGTLQGLDVPDVDHVVDTPETETETEVENNMNSITAELESVSSSSSSPSCFHPSSDGSDLASSTCLSGASTPPPELANPQHQHQDNLKDKDKDQVHDQNQNSLSCWPTNALWSYFASTPVFTTASFPPDADTTAIAYLNIPASHRHRLAPASVIAKAMLANRSPEGEGGYFETYFVADRPRISPEVCVNILRFFVRFGRECRVSSLDECLSDSHSNSKHDVDGASMMKMIAPSLNLVLDSLRFRASLYGSRYYTVPEVFLYYAAMLCVESRVSAPVFSRDLEMQLSSALRERLHVKTNALALAMRVRAWQVLGLERTAVKEDWEELLAFQEADGGWPAGHFCTFVKADRKIGSRGMTTALAWRVLRDYGAE